jgi:hypothetical protein
MIRVVHPGSRIPDPDADFLTSRIPDPGVKKVPNPGSRIRIRNTVCSVPEHSGTGVGPLIPELTFVVSFLPG